MSEHDQAQERETPITKTVTLTKQGQRFLFRYELGEEFQLLDTLIEMVNRRDLSFDWFDAAVVAHQVGDHIAQELKGHLPNKA